MFDFDFEIEEDPTMTRPGGTEIKMSKQTSFKLFSSQQRSRLTALYPFLTAEQINRKVLTMWSKLSLAEKKDFGYGNISSSCFTPKRISRISVLCTPRLTSKQLKTDNLRHNAQLESANRTFDFDFLSPEMPVKPLHLCDEVRHALPKAAGTRRDQSKPKVLSKDCHTSDISMVGKKNTTSSCKKVQRGRTKSQPTLPHSLSRPAPKPCTPTKECNLLKLDKPPDNTSCIQGRSSSYDDFESIDKENLIVETEDHLPPFRPKWGETTYTGRSFTLVTTYAAPEVIDDTPSEKPGILRKSVEKPKQRRVSFSETELRSVITFEQKSSQGSTDPLEGVSTVDCAKNYKKGVVEVVGTMAKVTDAVERPSRVGVENEMMKRAAFYASLMADVSDDTEEDGLNSSQDQTVSCLIKEQNTGVQVVSVNGRRGRGRQRGGGRGKHKWVVGHARRGNGQGGGSVRTRSEAKSLRNKKRKEHASVLMNQQYMSLNADKAEVIEDESKKNECHHGILLSTSFEEKTARGRGLPRNNGSGYSTRGRGQNGKQLTGSRNASNSEGAGAGNSRDLSVYDLSESETDEPIAKKKSGRFLCRSGGDLGETVGCEETIGAGIVEIGDDGRAEKKQGEGTQDVGYGLRKRPRRELTGCHLFNRRRTTSDKTHEQQGSLVLSTNKVVTVAEIHAVSERNYCEESHSDVDLERFDTFGGGGDADQSVDKREKKADGKSGEALKYLNGVEDTSDQQKPRRLRERRQFPHNVSPQLKEKQPIKRFAGPEVLSAVEQDKFHRIDSVSDETDEPVAEDQASSQNVSPAITDIVSDLALRPHEELMTPLMAKPSVDVETVELVTPMTDVGLIVEINNQVQLAPRKGRSDQNEDNLRSPMMGITAVPCNELEFVTPMTDVGLIQEIKNQVKLAPKKGQSDPKADLMTPLMGSTLVPSNELELITPMTDVRLIEKIQNQVQLAPKKYKYCPDCQEDKSEDQKVAGHGQENSGTDSANAARMLWDETRQNVEGDERHSKLTKTQLERKGQSLEMPEMESCLPDSRKVKESTGLAQPSSSDQSQESTGNETSSTLHSVDSFCLDPCAIFNTSPPDRQDVAMMMKQTTQFSVAQAVRNMQMIGCVSLISPVSSILSASLSGVSQLSSTSSLASCDEDVLDYVEDTATLPELNNEDVKDVLTDIDDESQDQTSVDPQPCLSAIEQSGCCGVWQSAIQNPSNHGNNNADGDLCDMFQNTTPPKSVKKSGRRLIASNQKGDNQICSVFEDENIFL